MIDNALAPALDALLGDGEDRSRLARARGALSVEPPPASYADLLTELVVDHSEAVRCIAAYHAAELDMHEVTEHLEEARERAEGLTLEVVERALASLRDVALKPGVGGPLVGT